MKDYKVDFDTAVYQTEWRPPCVW